MNAICYIWALLVSLYANLTGILLFLNNGIRLRVWQIVFMVIAGIILILVLICHPQKKKIEDKRNRALSNGCVLLKIYLISSVITLIAQVCVAAKAFPVVFHSDGLLEGRTLLLWILSLLTAVVIESIVFLAGIIRLYTSSVQLGIRHRVIGLILMWIPIVNLFYLIKMIRITETEIKIETEKIELDNTREFNEICKTKYPILMVHGVFFRDFRYLNYWGRIPNELKKNGATIYYGKQQSAASVMECGKELADRILEIIEESGCGKVNIIAHSKGGLDSRAAISIYGMDKYVASLTTINTPHRGCMFADYLLSVIPSKTCMTIASAYNRSLKKLGDREPDFMCAVQDLTANACEKLNDMMPDSPDVLYESVMSYCRKAKSGRFPLNMSYNLVKHFDGQNDGLVSVPSAKWGSDFKLLTPNGSRGISHGDMIDLNRENIPGFDVREFYVSLVSDLKRRGF